MLYTGCSIKKSPKKLNISKKIKLKLMRFAAFKFDGHYYRF